MVCRKGVSPSGTEWMQSMDLVLGMDCDRYTKWGSFSERLISEEPVALGMD